jgi:hypothetical protein
MLSETKSSAPLKWIHGHFFLRHRQNLETPSRPHKVSLIQLRAGYQSPTGVSDPPRMKL